MKILFQIIGLFLFVTARSQNMVVNGDLEDFNICEENHAKCSPAGWFFIKADPIGYMNPGKIKKTISASGNCHLNIMVADTGSVNREYWLTKMLCNISPEKKYSISLKLSSPKADPDLGNIGIWLTNEMIYASIDTLLQPQDYINFIDAKIKPLDNGWVLVTKEIKAQKAASILVLGNFSPAANKEIILSRNKKNNKPVFVFVDDISVVASKKPPCLMDMAIKDTLYSERRRHTKLIPPRPPFFSEPPIRLEQQPAPSFQKIEYRPNGFSISSVQFAFDRFEITDYAVTIRLNVLKMVKNQIKKIEVVGYTDEIGYLTHNLELSKNRSLSVAKLLTDEIGVDPAIIQVRGAGVSHQFTKNELNRRVDIHIEWK